MTRPMVDLDDQECLAWLGPDELVFAFNPHKLIPREDGHPSGAERIIRAVLLDSKSRKILRAVDWEMTDARRFMWPLSGNRVLVHVGNELRVYAAGLAVERSVPLAGRLDFVRIAPNGEFVAIATRRERHSPELHQQLLELGHEPEEDVDLVILDNEFKTMAQASTVSTLVPPTLLNEGQVNMIQQPNSWYRLALRTWNNKASTLARFDSGCTPQLSSMAPDLLFLLSCSVGTGATEYRVIGANGKLLLRGTSGTQDGGYEAIGNSRRFALKLVHADHDISQGAPFKGADLDAQEVRIYQAADGKRLGSVRVDDPAPSRGTFALSEDGSQLAILSGAQVELFDLPAGKWSPVNRIGP